MNIIEILYEHNKFVEHNEIFVKKTIHCIKNNFRDHILCKIKCYQTLFLHSL